MAILFMLRVHLVKSFFQSVYKQHLKAGELNLGFGAVTVDLIVGL